ncbi:hypothetical protein ACFX1X_045917 [Malus domestica]
MEQMVQVQTSCMPFSRYKEDEEEAAKTYDIASLKFRGLDAIINNSRNKMKPYERDVTEALFLESHSKAEIVDMLRKHSYANELEIYKYKLYSGGAVGLDDGGKRMEALP